MRSTGPAVQTEDVALVDAVGRLVAATEFHHGGRIASVSKNADQCTIGPWYTLAGDGRRWLSGGWLIDVIVEGAGAPPVA